MYFTDISFFAAAKSLQLCPTLCNPIDCCPPGSPVPGIHQARILEWVAISFSNAWKWNASLCHWCCVRNKGVISYNRCFSPAHSQSELWIQYPRYPEATEKKMWLREASTLVSLEKAEKLMWKLALLFYQKSLISWSSPLAFVNPFSGFNHHLVWLSF